MKPASDVDPRLRRCSRIRGAMICQVCSSRAAAEKRPVRGGQQSITRERPSLAKRRRCNAAVTHATGQGSVWISQRVPEAQPGR